MNTNNYAHIALAEDEDHEGKMYEVLFVPSENGEFRLRHGAVNECFAKKGFPVGPMKGEFRSVRISYDSTTLKVEQYNFSGTWEFLAEFNRDENDDREINFCRIWSWTYEADWRVALSSIHTAIICKDLNSLQTLLDSNTSMETDLSGVPFMLRAIDVGDLDILKALKGAGAPIDTRAFQKVIENKCAEALGILLESPTTPLQGIEVWTDSSDDYWDDFGDICSALTLHNYRLFVSIPPCIIVIYYRLPVSMGSTR